MYLLVKCRLVTTPWSGVMCLQIASPPFLHAASTMYRCLKCDLYVVALGLRFLVFGLEEPNRPEVGRFGALLEGPGNMLSYARLGEPLDDFWL